MGENLDFASVQRENPEMERRCQEVIDTCWRLEDANPNRIRCMTWVQQWYFERNAIVGESSRTRCCT